MALEAQRRLTKAENATMVRRLLRGEPADVIANDLGVDASLPPLRAHQWGFIPQRFRLVREEDITPAGLAWLAANA